MASRLQIVTFDDPEPPPGMSAWLSGAGPATGIELVEPDPCWPQRFAELAARIREALGDRALRIEHVGSTSVPGLAAKPIIDITLELADTEDEAGYIPQLEAAGFRHVVREPWWYGHRCLVADSPKCNLHVFPADTAEAVRHRIFRDWLRMNDADRDLYAATKRQAASAANAAREHVMDYNARKQAVIRAIYDRAFRAADLPDA